jgi:hypothetical protein
MSFERIDLDAEEADLDRLLAAARPAPLPIGFRDVVMSRLRSDRRVTWEWIVAALFALPSVAYLARLILVHGDDVMAAIGNIVAAASTDTTDAFFFVDGVTVIALALLGVACAFAAHALAVSAPDTRRLAR